MAPGWDLASLIAPKAFPIRAALFDLDGTLVHTPIDFGAMKREVLEEVRLAGLDPEPLRRLDVLAIIARAEAALKESASFRHRAEEVLVRIELTACREAAEAEGAAETLRWLLQRGVRVGIVTRNCAPAVRAVLERIPFPHDVLLTRGDTPRVKPDPLHLRMALERLRVPPAAAVMVGDHTMDVLGGRAAGTRTVGVLLPERPPDYFHEAAPDLVIRKLPELREWISPS